jgi:hypothetical protein
MRIVPLDILGVEAQTGQPPPEQSVEMAGYVGGRLARCLQTGGP